MKQLENLLTIQAKQLVKSLPKKQQAREFKNMKYIIRKFAAKQKKDKMNLLKFTEKDILQFGREMLDTAKETKESVLIMHNLNLLCRLIGTDTKCLDELLKTQTVFCKCGMKAKMIREKDLYHKIYNNGYRYICPKCGAIGGVHVGTTIPYGTLADAELRKKRLQVHQKFDALWKSKNAVMTRSEAYEYLADMLCIPVQSAHIGGFDKEMCDLVLAELN